ncbi:MAG: hypothetical protein LW713_05905 [Acetobacteraceae bacterium]|nr:hypothetical protein [Acetobacteraceae bacterium]
MNERKSESNLRNGIIAGVAASVGMMLGHIFFDEQPVLIKGVLSVVIAVTTALCLNVVVKIFRKPKGEG